jgi:isochorismate synthase EntC
MMLRTDRAWAFAGGGIVATSNPRDEWRETELKLAGITDAVSLELESGEHDSRQASNA